MALIYCTECRTLLGGDEKGCCPRCGHDPDGVVHGMGGWGRRTRARIVERDGPNCWLCGKKVKRGATIDHYVPRSKGGSNELENLRLAHDECNRERGNKDPEVSSKVVRADPLPLLRGSKRRKRLRPGDDVLDPDGRPARVVDVERPEDGPETIWTWAEGDEDEFPYSTAELTLVET